MTRRTWHVMNIVALLACGFLFSIASMRWQPAPAPASPPAAPSVTPDLGDDQEACQRCGDGYCARSCENERTCPQDCGPST